jgi:catechol 2,3-dioxygenase-like lactoylglutathione lyase family enzyme
MTIQRMDHVSLVVDDLEAAIDFFVTLGLERLGEATVHGPWVDRLLALDGVRSDIAFVQTPDGHSRLELTKFHTPPGPAGDGPLPANAPGLRHLAFEVSGLDAILASLQARGTELVGQLGQYEDVYRLCYVRGPEGIIVELAERIG